MSRLRLWILGAALGSFVAGINFGLAGSHLFAASEEPLHGDEIYIRQLVADYDLDPDQQRSLRLVLMKWREEEIAVIESVDPAQLPPGARREMLAARGRLERRIRAILDEEQRARYDLAIQPK